VPDFWHFFRLRSCPNQTAAAAIIEKAGLDISCRIIYAIL